MREQSAADPTATEDDLETMDTYIRWWREKIDAHDNQWERRQAKTRERVARWRATKKATAAKRSPPAKNRA